MKQQDLLHIEKGARVRIQEYDSNDTPTQIRTAEVMAVLQLTINGKEIPHAAVHFLEDNSPYQCVPLAHIVEVCADSAP